MKKPVLIGLGLTALAGLGWYIGNQVSLAKKLCFKVIGYKVNSFSLQSASIQLRMQVRNLGDLSVTIKNYKINIFGNNYYLATAQSVSETVISPNGVMDVLIDVNLSPKLVFSNILNILSTTDGLTTLKSTMLEFKGNVKLSKFGIPFLIPINYGLKLGDISSDKDANSPC